MFNQGRNGGSSSSQQSSTYSRYSTESTYRRAGADSGDDDEFPKKRETDHKKRNRWDDRGNSADHHHKRNHERHERRSRSPVSSRDRDSSLVSLVRLNEKKASNNWSDSSDDDKVDSRRSYRRSAHSDEQPIRNEKNNNREDFERRTSVFQPKFLDTQNLQHFSVSPGSKNTKQEYDSSPAASSVKNSITSGIQIKLLPQVVKPTPISASAIKPKSMKIASIFNVDDDDDEEEMPPECRMRMKNIGRDTPTSAGPNSFGKTKIGFCNVIQIKEKKLQEEMEKK